MTLEEFIALCDDPEIQSQAEAYLSLRREYDASIDFTDVIRLAAESVMLEGRTGRDAVLLELMERHECMRVALDELDSPLLFDETVKQHVREFYDHAAGSSEGPDAPTLEATS